MASKQLVLEFTAKDVTGKHSNRPGRLPFRAATQNILAEVSQSQSQSSLMIYPTNGNGQQQQQQLAHRGRDRTRTFGGPGNGTRSGTSSGFSSRSTTPTPSEDGTTRQQNQNQSQNQNKQQGVHSVSISGHKLTKDGKFQPNIVFLANDSTRAVDAKIENNEASSGEQWNLAGSETAIMRFAELMKDRK